MADDLGWGDPGFNDGWIETPHLDRFAREGMVFDRFYSAAPVCSPTRGSVLTGRHPSRYGITGANVGHLPTDELTVAEALAERGYATGFFGKWHLGTLTTSIEDSNRGGPKHAAHFSPPQQHGFECVFATEAKVPTFDPMRRPGPDATTPRQGNTWWDPVRGDEAAPYGTRYWDERGVIVTTDLEGDDSRIIMDRATTFIASVAKREAPFLAVIWFHAPHLPVVSDVSSDLAPYARHYRGSVIGIDEAMNMLRTALVDSAVADDTLVIFCSDNGPEGNDAAPGRTGSLRGRKRSLHEGGVRVPAFAWWPDVIDGGRRTSEPVVTSDLLPTVLDLLGAAPPGAVSLDGVTFAPLLRKEPWSRRTPIGFATPKQETWIEKRFKLVRARSGGDATIELYDVVADPGEQRDVAATHPDVVARMTTALDGWLAVCRD